MVEWTSESLCARFLMHELLKRDKPLRLSQETLDNYGKYKLVFAHQKSLDGLIEVWLESNEVVPGELVDKELTEE